MPLIVVHSTVQLAFFVDKSQTCKNQNFTSDQIPQCTSFGLLGVHIFCYFLQIMPFPSVQIYSTNVLSILVIDIQN